LNYVLAIAGATLFILGIITGISGCSMSGDYATAGICGWLAAVAGAVLSSTAHLADEIQKKRRPD
jgi:hypothetical protein